MNDNLSLAIEAALKAGKAIMEIYQKDFTVDFKEDDSPLTDADRKSDEIIKTILGNSFPIISEESKVLPYRDREGWQTCWLVDPLDGTKEFVKKNGEFTVNIALIEHGLPVLGVVFLPVMSQLYFGTNETGSYSCVIQPADKKPPALSVLMNNGIKLDELPLPKKYTVVASRSHLSPETIHFINTCKEKYGTVELISKGSSIKLCLVAEGKAHVYPRIAPTMEWDTAAAHAVAKFAGCRVVDFNTKEELSYNKENLLNPYFIVSR